MGNVINKNRELVRKYARNFGYIAIEPIVFRKGMKVIAVDTSEYDKVDRFAVSEVLCINPEIEFTSDIVKGEIKYRFVDDIYEKELGLEGTYKYIIKDLYKNNNIIFLSNARGVVKVLK